MATFKNLTQKNILSEVQFYTVEKISGNKVQLKNQRGENIVVDDKYVENCLSSANDFSKTESLNRTDLIKKFLDSTNIVFTVTFQKQVKDKDVITELEALYPNSGKIIAKADYTKAVKAAVKKALDGETRVLKGYHVGNVDEFGRIQAVDMEITSGYSFRLVDPRTISELIVGNVKYKVKS